jgi:hypothetical protein
LPFFSVIVSGDRVSPIEILAKSPTGSTTPIANADNFRQRGNDHAIHKAVTIPTPTVGNANRMAPTDPKPPLLDIAAIKTQGETSKTELIMMRHQETLEVSCKLDCIKNPATPIINGIGQKL